MRNKMMGIISNFIQKNLSEEPLDYVYFVRDVVERLLQQELKGEYRYKNKDIISTLTSEGNFKIDQEQFLAHLHQFFPENKDPLSSEFLLMKYLLTGEVLMYLEQNTQMSIHEFLKEGGYYPQTKNKYFVSTTQEGVLKKMVLFNTFENAKSYFVFLTKNLGENELGRGSEYVFKLGSNVYQYGPVNLNP